MDPARFADDLALIPSALNRLGDALDTGLPGLFEVARMRERSGGAPRVLLLGMGSSAYAVDVVAREARAVGAPVWAELASTADLPEPATDLVVVAVSATGGSVEVLDAVRRYAELDRLIAVTNRSGSALEASSGVTVPQLAGEEASGIACRSFRHTLLVLRAVVAELAPADHAVRTRFSELGTVARAGADANEVLADTASQWLGPVSDALAAPMGTWVLAPVERLSSSRQSALMLREIPRRAAYASETGDWSHVDVYLTKTQDYRALIYSGSKWDAQALEWMRSRGATWVSVGAELPGAAHAVPVLGGADLRVAQLAELAVAERVAAHWLSAA